MQPCHQAVWPFAMQVELKSGETYRGELNDAEDNWNCQLKNVTATARVRSCSSPARSLVPDHWLMGSRGRESDGHCRVSDHSSSK